jgi:hypothetical protein
MTTWPFDPDGVCWLTSRHEVAFHHTPPTSEAPRIVQQTPPLERRTLSLERDPRSGINRATARLTTPLVQ